MENARWGRDDGTPDLPAGGVLGENLFFHPRSALSSAAMLELSKATIADSMSDDFDASSPGLRPNIAFSPPK